jgi:hypothetical protein
LLRSARGRLGGAVRPGEPIVVGACRQVDLDEPPRRLRSPGGQTGRGGGVGAGRAVGASGCLGGEQRGVGGRLADLEWDLRRFRERAGKPGIAPLQRAQRRLVGQRVLLGEREQSVAQLDRLRASAASLDPAAVSLVLVVFVAAGHTRHR